MGGGGGGGFNLSPLMNPFANIGNRAIEDKKKRAIANIFDVSGANVNTQSAFGGAEAADKMGVTAYGSPKTPEATPTPAPVIEPDPAIAEAAATEESRKEEMRKRRIRTKTLLTSQQGDTNSATVGTKILLGG